VLSKHSEGAASSLLHAASAGNRQSPTSRCIRGLESEREDELFITTSEQS
jgi:hypothetical protein